MTFQTVKQALVQAVHLQNVLQNAEFRMKSSQITPCTVYLFLNSPLKLGPFVYLCMVAYWNFMRLVQPLFRLSQNVQKMKM